MKNKNKKVENVSLYRPLKNLSFLTIAYIISYIIQFFGFVFISRMLGPSEYGIYSIVGAFVGFFTLFTFGGLNRVALRECSNNIHELEKILNSIIGLRRNFCFLAMFLCLISLFFTDYSLRTKTLIVIFSMELIIGPFTSFLDILFQSIEKMKYTSFLMLFRTGLTYSISIALLYMGYGIFELTLSMLFVNLLTFLVSYKISKKYARIKFLNSSEYDLEIIKPAIIFSAIAFVTIIGTRVDILLLSFLTTSEDVGVYSVASKLVLLGVSIRNLVGTAFFPYTVKYLKDNTIIFGDLIIFYLSFTLFFMFMFFLNSLFGEQIMVQLFTENFKGSFEVFELLLLYLFFVWISFPIEILCNATKNEILVLKSKTLAAIINIPLSLLFFFRFGLVGVAYATVLVYAITFLALFIIGIGSLTKQGFLTFKFKNRVKHLLSR